MKKIKKSIKIVQILCVLIWFIYSFSVAFTGIVDCVALHEIISTIMSFAAKILILELVLSMLALTVNEINK